MSNISTIILRICEHFPVKKLDYKTLIVYYPLGKNTIDAISKKYNLDIQSVKPVGDNKTMQAIFTYNKIG